MSTVYYPDNATSDLNFNTVTAPASSKQLLRTAAGSATSVTITLAASASNQSCWFITPAGDPDTTPGSVVGDYTLLINVTTRSTSLTGGTSSSRQISRINSAGVIQTSATDGLAAATWPQTTGVKTFTFTAANLGTWASGDRFMFGIRLTNTNSMASASIVIEVGLASGNEQITTPWTFAAAPTSLAVAHRPVARNSLLRR